MKPVASAGVWGGFAGAPLLTHWHVGQGPGHMGLVARSEASEPEVGGACDGCGTLQSPLTFALLFMGVSFTSCHTGSH